MVFLLVQNIGALAGLPFAPYLTDWAGRRKGIFVGAAISELCFIRCSLGAL